MDQEIKTFLIPNEMCRRSGIAGTFISSHQIGIFPSQPVKSHHQDSQTPYVTNTSASVFQVRPEVILFQPILRRLVNETAGVFIQLQLHVSTGPDARKDLIQYSIQYRSVIRAALEMLQDKIMRSEGVVEIGELREQITIFYSVECIWHLCEILYIQNTPGHYVKSHLLEWVRFHIPKYERNAVNLMNDEIGTGLESHPDYWHTVIGCLLQGRTEIVCVLLEMHSNAAITAFRLAVQALKAMPVYDLSEGISVTEFHLRRKHWLLDLQAKLDGKMFMAETRVEFMMQLLVGDEMAWSKAQEQCEEWYELLAAWLFYTEPTIKTFELGRYAKKCINRMNKPVRYLDRVLLAAMEKDIELVSELQCLNENGWFVTHLMDLLYHAGQLDTWKTEETTAEVLRESFLMEYATLLMEHHSLWQVALKYFDFCPTQGSFAIELLLPRLATNERKAEKILREVTKRSLPHLAFSISKIQCREALKRGQLGNALLWALKSQDSEYISHIVDKLLAHYVKTQNLICVDLIENLGPSILASDSLIFLGKYYEFKSHLDGNRFQKAASVLVSLIGSEFTPGNFWGVLLSDTLPLLENKDPVLSANDTLIIMNCLQERKSSQQTETATAIRLAMARNLARVFV